MDSGKTECFKRNGHDGVEIKSPNFFKKTDRVALKFLKCIFFYAGATGETFSVPVVHESVPELLIERTSMRGWETGAVTVGADPPAKMTRVAPTK